MPSGGICLWHSCLSATSPVTPVLPHYRRTKQCPHVDFPLAVCKLLVFPHNCTPSRE